MVAITDERLGAVSQEEVPRQRRFPWSLRGYRRSAVDQHIGELERELGELDRELVGLRAAATLREEVADEMRRISEETAGVLTDAHRRRAEMIQAAEEESQRLITDATARANAITADGEARLCELEAQRVTVHQERDLLLENALAASVALADAVNAAREHVPLIAADTEAREDEAGHAPSLVSDQPS